MFSHKMSIVTTFGHKHFKDFKQNLFSKDIYENFIGLQYVFVHIWNIIVNFEAISFQ